VAAIEDIIDRIYFGGSLVLFVGDCFFDGLEHILTSIADFGLIELFLPECFQLDIIFLKGEVVVVVPLPHYEDVVFESVFNLFVDVEVINASLYDIVHLYLLFGLLVEVLNRREDTFLVLAMCYFSCTYYYLRASHCFLFLSS
jgi:hypothetical protein